MSSADNAPLYNIRDRKPCKLLSYVPAPQQLCGTHSCGKRAGKGHFHGTSTHAGGAGTCSGLRGMRTAKPPENVVHPLVPGVPVWVNSDWEADVDSRRSHTGYIIMLNGGSVSWKSRRQDCVSLSTSQGEYVAASQCGQEVYYMREILRDFGYAHPPIQTAPTHIYEDNLACVAMSENPVRGKFSRHIDIRRYIVRNMVIKLVPLRYPSHGSECLD
jgi:hypothetical protein